MTLTLDAELAERAHLRATREGFPSVEAWLDAFLSAEDEDDVERTAVRAAVAQGLAEIRAGQSRSAAEAIAEIIAKRHNAADRS